MCCNPANGRVEFEDGWLLNPSFITKNEIKACQLTMTKFQKKKKTRKQKIENCFKFGKPSIINLPNVCLSAFINISGLNFILWYLN
jgi:hypothetical protein